MKGICHADAEKEVKNSTFMHVCDNYHGSISESKAWLGKYILYELSSDELHGIKWEDDLEKAMELNYLTSFGSQYLGEWRSQSNFAPPLTPKTVCWPLYFKLLVNRRVHANEGHLYQLHHLLLPFPPPSLHLLLINHILYPHLFHGRFHTCWQPFSLAHHSLWRGCGS